MARLMYVYEVWDSRRWIVEFLDRAKILQFFTIATTTSTRAIGVDGLYFAGNLKKTSVREDGCPQHFPDDWSYSFIIILSL